MQEDYLFTGSQIKSSETRVYIFSTVLVAIHQRRPAYPGEGVRGKSIPIFNEILLLN